jgi:hypothetical protein
VLLIESCINFTFFQLKSFFEEATTKKHVQALGRVDVNSKKRIEIEKKKSQPFVVDSFLVESFG